VHKDLESESKRLAESSAGRKGFEFIDFT